MNLSDADLELLNAYHDNELDDYEAMALRNRLDNEPALRRALDEIREVSRALKPLKPEAGARAGAAATTWRRKTGLTAAAAAAIIALACGALLIQLLEKNPSPADWHKTFLSKSYPSAEEVVITPVTQWIGRAPDLSAANLTLVDMATTGNGELYLHYSGVNGCRLTFGIYSHKPGADTGAGSPLVHTWSKGATYYSIVADGMDHGKFLAITKLLEEISGGKTKPDDTVIALREATKSALPCA